MQCQRDAAHNFIDSDLFDLGIFNLPPSSNTRFASNRPNKVLKVLGIRGILALRVGVPQLIRARVNRRVINVDQSRQLNARLPAVGLKREIEIQRLVVQGKCFRIIPQMEMTLGGHRPKTDRIKIIAGFQLDTSIRLRRENSCPPIDNRLGSIPERGNSTVGWAAEPATARSSSKATAANRPTRIDWRRLIKKILIPMFSSYLVKPLPTVRSTRFYRSAGSSDKTSIKDKQVLIALV